MTAVTDRTVALRHPDRFYIDGEWVQPSSADQIQVLDSATEEVFLTVAEARDADVARAVGAARQAFDEGPWPRMTYAERATYLRAIGNGLRERAEDIQNVWVMESGVRYVIATAFVAYAAWQFEYYAGLAETFPFEEPAVPAGGDGYGFLVREPVGVVGVIIPWNGPLGLIVQKIAPALLAGCTVIVKSPPEAPADGLILAEVVESIGLPGGVVNVITADREVSESLVRDSRVDKITMTGSTAAGRRIASIMGERIGRVTLELGGKSAAVVLDDYDIATAAKELVDSELLINGQACSSLTRIVVTQSRHDEMVEALASLFAAVQVGDPFDPACGCGPLVSDRQRQKVLGLLAKGREDGAVVATGGGRPAHLPKGYYVEPTILGRVDNSTVIAQEEIFGPVLCVIPARDEEDAIRIADDTIYGLNASVFTDDVERAWQVARRLRSGTVGHNSFRSDTSIAFGGFKQSGIGREGGVEGLLPFLESKTIILAKPRSASAS